MVAMWHSLQFGVCQDCAKNDSWLSSRKPRLAKVPISFKKNGAPDRIRTCDLCLRRAALYPAELRVRGGSFSRLAGPRQRPARAKAGGPGPHFPATISRYSLSHVRRAVAAWLEQFPHLRTRLGGAEQIALH